MAKPKIGFIGIGVMGDPMVKNLLKAGYFVTVYDLAKARTAEVVKAGAVGARSNAELAATAEVVIVMVDTTEAARAALFGQQGAWETIRSGSTVIIMSSIDPYFCQEVAAKGRKKGVDFLDVTVIGAGAAVKEGTVPLFCGGDAAVLKKYRALLTAMGNRIYHIGGAGMGEVAKICANYIITVTGAVLADAIRIAAAAGIDPDMLHEALLSSSANSVTLQKSWHVLAKEAARPGTKVVRTPPRNLYKDLGLTMALARKLGLFIPIAGVTSQLDLSRWVPAAPARPKKK